MLLGGDNFDEDPDIANAVARLTFDVDHLPSPTISYLYIWPEFFKYDIEIIKPKNSRYVNLLSNSENACRKILVRAPENVRISAAMSAASTGADIQNGTLVNFDHTTNQSQCLFAPSSVGTPFELTLFARYQDDNQSQGIVEFDLTVISRGDLKQSTTFPQILLPF